MQTIFNQVFNQDISDLVIFSLVQKVQYYQQGNYYLLHVKFANYKKFTKCLLINKHYNSLVKICNIWLRRYLQWKSGGSIFQDQTKS